MLAIQAVPPRIAEIVQANFGIIGGTLACYLLAFLAITYYSHTRLQRNITDFAVANRDLGWLLVAFSLYASITSGVGMAGFPGFIYVNGLPFIAGTLTGYSLMTILVWYLGRRLKVLGDEHALNTPGDLLGAYYQSDTMRILTSVVSILFYIPFLTAQFVAAGILMHVLTGTIVPQQVGTIVIATIVVAHVITTGLRGIAWLDTFNGLIMTAMFLVFFVYVMLDAGGPTSVMAGLREAGAGDHFSLPGPTGWNPNMIYGLAIGFYAASAIASPHSIIRFFSTDRVENMVKVALAILVLFAIQHLLGTYWMGTYGRVVFPGAENPDYISSLLAIEIMPTFFTAAFLIAVLGAIISTCDSYLHVFSNVLSRDALRRVFLPGMGDREELRTNYVLVFLGALVSVVLALNFEGLIVSLALYAAGSASQILPAIVGATVWPRASTEAAILSTITGIVLLTLWFFEVAAYPLSWLGPSYFTAFVINSLVFVAVSFLTRPQPASIVERFHGVVRRAI